MKRIKQIVTDFYNLNKIRRLALPTILCEVSLIL
jgi:hypothetical protein